MRRGSVLVTSMITMMFIVVIGMAVLSLTVQGVHMTAKIKNQTVAFNLAESGVDRTVRWFKKLGSPPSIKDEFDPFGGVQKLNGGSYVVTVFPYDDNGGATLKKYRVRVSGFYGKESEEVEIVLRQSSFGKYAYFTDRETSASSDGRIWFFSGDKIRGPAHSNNKSDSSFQINWGGDGPIFEAMVTAAGEEIDFAPKDPKNEDQFKQVFSAGSKGYQLGVDTIPLPASSLEQKALAWGSDDPYPSTTGVYVHTDGGIFVQGDAAIALQVDGSGNQQFKFTQGKTVTTLTIDLANKRIGRQVGSGETTYIEGTVNGVLYCQGDVTSLAGTVADNIVAGDPPVVAFRNAYTIVTDVNSGKDIKVTAPIKHRTPYDPALGPSDPANLSSGSLGLFASNITISEKAPTDMEIDAIMLAGSDSTKDGSFGVENYDEKKPTGTLKIMGGIIQKARGAVGTFSGKSIKTGYAKDYWYDARMADDPPPHFPTTGGYDRVSWRRPPG